MVYSHTGRLFPRLAILPSHQHSSRRVCLVITISIQGQIQRQTDLKCLDSALEAGVSQPTAQHDPAMPLLKASPRGHLYDDVWLIHHVTLPDQNPTAQAMQDWQHTAAQQSGQGQAQWQANMQAELDTQQAQQETQQQAQNQPQNQQQGSGREPFGSLTNRR